MCDVIVEDCDVKQTTGAHLVHAHNITTEDDFNSSYKTFYRWKD